MEAMPITVRRPWYDVIAAEVSSPVQKSPFLARRQRRWPSSRALWKCKRSHSLLNIFISLWKGLIWQGWHQLSPLVQILRNLKWSKLTQITWLEHFSNQENDIFRLKWTILVRKWPFSSFSARKWQKKWQFYQIKPLACVSFCNFGAFISFLNVDRDEIQFFICCLFCISWKSCDDWYCPLGLFQVTLVHVRVHARVSFTGVLCGHPTKIKRGTV